MKQEIKNCQNCENEFLIDEQDQAFYKKIDVPQPTLCPKCRYQRRLIHRNELNLYRRTCDATGESIISIYRPGVVFPVYKQAAWWADGWDAMEYGRDYDFSRPFLNNFMSFP